MTYKSTEIRRIKIRFALLPCLLVCLQYTTSSVSFALVIYALMDFHLKLHYTRLTPCISVEKSSFLLSSLFQQHLTMSPHLVTQTSTHTHTEPTDAALLIL